MVKIAEELEEFVNKLFPKLEEQMRMAQMEPKVVSFIVKCVIISIIFGINVALVISLIFRNYGFLLILLPSFLFFFIISFFLCLRIPQVNIAKVRKDIENDVFIPSRMLLTLLEAGNSLITALERASYTKAKSSKFFGKIASEIYLGKNIDQAIDDAIKYTPSDSFRRVLEPIKKSLRTGADIQKNLLSTLQDLSNEKIVEIESYEKKLAPLSMFYMIFGTIIPALGVVGLVIILSIVGVRIEFFPFLFILLVLILFIQLFFVRLFKSIRPLVKL